ncbi:hypothetical protein [Geodermatophilus sp. DSM 44513]|uniref:hypothetical protein n=1 Tax=Geodermatophilus sp. DSM 44513 TaxID=1528104 RepID=UPI00126D0CAD|nr:hypothetical protein [Geodermatophilus sp. DSM 44513]WNV76711.1 hypothetical protein RTG05_05405 [Geodermatophilus sp. DSM 44513]
MEWLRLQRRAALPQPFLQLAAAYWAGGREREARKILMARHNEGLRLRNIGRQLLRITVGHGYEPLRALLLAFAIFSAGCVVFNYGARHELLVPSRTTTAVSSNCDAKTYPCLSPYVYSLDTLLPVINLRQRDHWVPDPEDGQWVAVFAWTSTVLGWVLGLLVVAGFSGLVRRE